MNEPVMRAVLDCMVYAQSLINPRGPAGECLERGTRGEFRIILSRHILSEILELPGKLPPHLNISPEQVAKLLDQVVPRSLLLLDVPHVFDHPIDPDDSDYVDLALATNARLIVSRDRHLLGLCDAAKPWSAEFRQRFPNFRVLTPEGLLALLRQIGEQQLDVPDTK